MKDVSAEVSRSRVAGCHAVIKWTNKPTCREFRLVYALTVSQTHLLVGTETTPGFALNASVEISALYLRTQKL
jgi:hypothetical protein